MRLILFRPGGLTTGLGTSFLKRQDSVQCPIHQRCLAGTSPQMKGQLIAIFPNPISKASMQTHDLGIVELLRVGFRFGMIDRESYWVAGV